MENNIYFSLINNGDITIQYIEDESGEPNLNVSAKDEKLLESLDFEGLVNYVTECLLVASFAGFEAPTEFYKIIKEYVESEGGGLGND